MKLDESCFGKKIRHNGWDKDDYFIPLANHPEREHIIIGVDQSGVPSSVTKSFMNDGEFYEEPNKKEDQVEIDGDRIAAWIVDIISNHREYIPESGPCLKSGTHISPALFRSICAEVAKVIHQVKFNTVAKSKSEQPKPKKRIEAAPAVLCLDGDYFVSGCFYSSFEEASRRGAGKFIKWPADWCAEKGVWYYEYE